MPSVQPFVSSENLRKGSRWAIDLARELDETSFGIVCLTSSNQQTPWLLFEAGALSKSLSESQVCTLLLGKLRPSEIKGPLEGFQHTVFNQKDVLKLVQDINAKLGNSSRDVASLERVFNSFWPGLERDVNEALKHPQEIVKAPKREANDLFAEILDRIRSMEQLLLPQEALGSALSDAMERYSASQHFARMRAQIAAIPTPIIVHDQKVITDLWSRFIQQVKARHPKASSVIATGRPLIVVDNWLLAFYTDEEGKIMSYLNELNELLSLDEMLTRLWKNKLQIAPLISR